MLLQILVGSILVLVTTVVHGGCTFGVLAALRRVHADRWELRSRWTEVLLISVVVLLLFLVALLEAAIWAATYFGVGAISGFEEALYFSTVTYTTLGYGDVVLHESWRILGAFEAANGIIMFGWTTALIVALLQQIYSRRREAASPNP